MLNTEGYNYLFKIVLAGNTAVGKTSITNKFVDDIFHKTVNTTIGVDFKAKIIDVDGIKYKIKIWDTAGQERFRSITKSYYKQGDAILIIFDVSNYESFHDLDRWLHEIREVNDTASIFIIGNKADLKKIVNQKDIDEYINNNNLNYIECSAKTSDNITHIFEEVIKVLYEKITEYNTLINSDSGKNVRFNLINQEKKSCCF